MSALQKFNYHTHTYRCGHAIGKEEEMIQAAIQGGFSIIGISEHMGYLGWDDPKERIAYEELDDYLDVMYALKEKYKDQIDVRIGFECEYFSDMKEHLQKMKQRCDYLICGQHAIDRKEHYYHDPAYSNDEDIEYMADQVCEGIALGLFDYIAHPDYFVQSKNPLTPRKKEAIRRIAKCAKQYDVVLEVNIKGMKYGTMMCDGKETYYYPNYSIFSIIAQEGCKVCFGYDAHFPDALIHREKEMQLREWFAPLSLNFIDSLDLRRK